MSEAPSEPELGAEAMPDQLPTDEGDVPPTPTPTESIEDQKETNARRESTKEPKTDPRRDSKGTARKSDASKEGTGAARKSDASKEGTGTARKSDASKDTAGAARKSDASKDTAGAARKSDASKDPTTGAARKSDASKDPTGTARKSDPNTLPPEDTLQPDGKKKSIDKSKKRVSMSDGLTDTTTTEGKVGATGDTKDKPGKVADVLAKDLAGTLQSFFTQEDKTNDSAVLKPLRRPKHIYENTFRLQAYNPFSRDKVQKILDVTLEEMVESVKYNSETANDIATKIAEKIRARIMALHFDRYKVVVMTNIGPLNRQGIHIGFRCLWDAEKDTYATASYKNATVFCSAVVYGIYYE